MTFIEVVINTFLEFLEDSIKEFLSWLVKCLISIHISHPYSLPEAYSFILALLIVCVILSVFSNSMHNQELNYYLKEISLLLCMHYDRTSLFHVPNFFIENIIKNDGTSLFCVADILIVKFECVSSFLMRFSGNFD